MVPYTMSNKTHFMSKKMSEAIDKCEAKIQEYHDSVEYVKVRPWDDVVVGEVFDVKTSKLWGAG